MKYSRIEDQEESVAFLNTTTNTIKAAPNQSRQAKIITLCNTIFFILSFSLFATWYYETRLQKNAHLRQVSSYSPLLDLIDLPMHLTTINGTLYPPKHDVPLARRPPSPEVDAIWEEWELTRVFPISTSQILAMGKDPSTASQLADAIWGLGTDAYASILDVYHQLHCLNSLRKLIYPEYYTTHGWKHSSDPKAMFEIHMNHCVDIILQAIQCSGNVNLMTLHWVEGEPWPFPDASVNRKCVDFESLTEWRKQNTVDLEKFNQTMDKPQGVQQMRAPDEYWRFFGKGRGKASHVGGENMGEGVQSIVERGCWHGFIPDLLISVNVCQQ